MKIAHMMAGAPQGGAELFFERMTIALHQAGEEVQPIIRPEPARIARLRAAGLNPATLRYGGPLDPFTRPRARRLLQSFGTDCVMAWMSRAAFHAPRGDWRLIGRLGGYYDLKYFRNCDHLVGNTHDIVRWIAGQGWPAKNLAYLPNFVTDFTDVPPAALDLPPGAPIVLALGRLHRVKGFDLLIHAIAQIPEIHLVIAGEGPERPALERIIAQSGLQSRIHLLGWRTDIGPLLKAATIFVSSSRHEPLGNMILEAFSAAIPTIATAAEGPSTLIRDGTDGLLTPIDDADALARAINRLLTTPDLAASLAQAGRARYQAEYAAPTVVATWRAYFTGLAR